ncbi:MAG: 16S rRNA (adenine(1518)-N(6)/adenine(1519)-N(6))-dimethyltransferase RsmA [Thermodesulfovibrionales bacterium]|nr:16S rRNA (adenine(1518)-N(6)/adenine(1519)-N(6))-dimethyltransferase RsmA [Thermodesulfovibrionales bacterium]
MPKKYLGQNFLFDPSILHKIIEVSNLTSDDTVIEIGPGHGKLTKMLAEIAKKVIAIELDLELYTRLKEEFERIKSYHSYTHLPIYPFNIEFIHGDALKYHYEKLGAFKVVSNIPYYITTPIIFRLIEARKNLKSMTLTIQKEVAQRIVAKPDTKDYGVLSIAVQYYAHPELKFIVPRGAFRPVPKVDSAVIHVEILEKPRVNVRDEKLFFRIVRTAFSQRRKTLSNSLKAISKDIKGILMDAEINPIRRAETLTIEEFAKLSNVLSFEHVPLSC